MLPAAEFWAELERAGVPLTDDYSPDGLSRYCWAKDGELFAVSVHDEYPKYMVSKVLMENGYMAMPLYDNLI